MKNDLDDLVCRLKQDDKGAFNTLFYMYAKKVFNFALTYYNDEQDAEEIVQEVFLKVWIKRHFITNPKTFNALVFTMAKNLVYNHLKRNVYKKRYQDYALRDADRLKNTTENEVHYQDLKHHLDQLIAKLPPKRKETFLLSRKHGYTNKEIAEEMNVSLKTVETHISLAIKYLREALHIDTDTILVLMLISTMGLR